MNSKMRRSCNLLVKISFEIVRIPLDSLFSVLISTDQNIPATTSTVYYFQLIFLQVLSFINVLWCNCDCVDCRWDCLHAPKLKHAKNIELRTIKTIDSITS